MVTIIEQQEIENIVSELELTSKMAEGFIQYSNGNSVVPPVGELWFEKPKGEAHIKYGYLKGSEYYTIKIASGFYNNPKLGISSSQGLVLLFSQQTGETVAILLDNGKLTDLRTAAAGAMVAQYFAPREIEGIGILGTGIQAKLQLEFLLKTCTCRDVWVWGRNEENATKFRDQFSSTANIKIAASPTEVAKGTNLIVTTTPSETPLLCAEDIRPGTHITAVGSDTAVKQELSADLLARTDLIISDSIVQSQTRGEVFKARKEGVPMSEKVIELGHALQNPEMQRTDDRQITIADLTGVAVQDIMIAEAVFKKHQEKH